MVFFLLRDSRELRRNFLKITPNTFFERFYFLYYQFLKKLGDYIFAKFIEASIVLIIITSGLLILNIKFAFLLGLIAGITNIIPYVGPFIGAIPAVVFGIAEYGWGASFGGIVILYLVANTIDLSLVFPLLVSKIVDLHPVLVVLSVILGSQFMGIIGMVISIPMAAALKLISIEIHNEIYNCRRA
jgi:putative permease